MYTQLLVPIERFLGCNTPDSWIVEARKPENLATLLIDHCNCEWKAAATAGKLLRKYAVSSQDVVVNMLKPYEFFLFRFDKWSIDEFQHWFFPESAANASSSDIKAAKQALYLLDKHGADLDSASTVLQWARTQPNLQVQQSTDTKEIETFYNPLQARTDFAQSDDLIAKMVRLIKEELHHFDQVLEIMQAWNIPYSNLPAGRYAKGLLTQVITHEPQTLIDKLIVGALIEARSCERFARLAPHLDEDLGRFYISLLRSEARHYQDYLTLAQSVAGQDISGRIAELVALEASLIQAKDTVFRFHSGIPA
ncbi:MULTISPECIES: tRNA isopentenyl-2-thiomethyl-A-37 hydroxylase MiaE [unclassified Shewanella]|jgi:tRNA-(ms[2]io[6]A)-hydroxylase|uniref:tRNA isopentenyl-2-thiomethyl-A-37 hydroxylase MiaE n=1 Tax=unclassified Shewanella TaxID=196818 RepID=UPI001A98A14E|nr:tRNA isopentenyl-2-thiomethyl-A-37 hydroxylase MiaE [Shewanella sp. 4t3-1-2LB]MBO1273232.1 tRNA-(ms[2]io[6]A)-hydroxylase [Shewanella sp. 4t3-1-2LB]